MTSINVGFGTGGSAWYDDIVDLSGGVLLEGAFFDGSTYLEAQLGNISTESYTYTLSFWYKIREDLPISEEEQVIFNVQNCRCELYGLRVWFQYSDTDGSMTLNVLSSAEDQSQRSQFKVIDVPTHDDTWHHVAIYEQSYPTNSSLYIDAVAKSLYRTSILTRNVPFNFPNQWRVASGNDDISIRYNGCLDELYFTYQDLDISISENLDKFINLTTKAARYLGPIGERPTGSQALIYFKDDCEDFYINYGNFPIDFSPFGDLICCTPEPINYCDNGMIFDDPNKPCGWIIRNPQVMCETPVDIIELEGTVWKDPDGYPGYENYSIATAGSGTPTSSTGITFSYWYKNKLDPLKTYSYPYMECGILTERAGLTSGQSKIYFDMFRADYDGGILGCEASGNFTNIENTKSAIYWLYNDDTHTLPWDDGLWHHIIYSIDGSVDPSLPGNAHFYIDGQLYGAGGEWDYYSAASGSFNFDISQAYWIIQEWFDSDMCLAELYFAPEYIDLSIPSNLAKFISGGEPVDLGADGSTPTGNQPMIYVSGPGETIRTNKGSLGNFIDNPSYGQTLEACAL